ncbi:ribosome biogenesis protein YTM1 [Punctularia strigosozonata HHB-11173 SS5]|uniref:ribosome biogenesis protein YTM1 n=1 Tax=Punctularia strigosozonata (strain HHB-11173) TaxID=741275 RepID=UPI00044173FE|nr:ribosome biogenesis protein YTM1 [Punctularia strigosozonata HHB-11173 SS5]EIN14717.1 ribosome biogenesis protein YTM1 [Punctularia strigosozonata HHB-11173 SS5]
MASSSTSSELSVPVIFHTHTPYPLPSQKFFIPASWKRYQLSQLVNKALALARPIPFDFLIDGEILRGSLGELGANTEETLQIEYIESVMPPQKMSSLPHEDWVSSISCKVPGYFVTASYDGHLRTFDYSQNKLNDVALHAAPITSACIVPQRIAGSPVVATASHDLTAHLTSLPSLGPDSENADAPSSRTLASLHLHTAPLSSVSSNSAGTHILTTSWDGLIGVWDTTIPQKDEVPLDAIHNTTGERNRKRRKVADSAGEEAKPRRKAPTAVMKSHTARVSKAVWAPSGPVAYSCGFDSTVRSWDVEMGVCTNTINASEKPFLDLALTADGHTALTASTDRFVTIYDLRSQGDATALSASSGSLPHPSTPSCVCVGPSGSQQVVTGAYDGVARIWDFRSTKSALASLKTWDGSGQKVLGVDWDTARGIIGIGGEGGMEVWKVGNTAAA